jgi:hypothetical protein
MTTATLSCSIAIWVRDGPPAGAAAAAAVAAAAAAEKEAAEEEKVLELVVVAPSALAAPYFKPSLSRGDVGGAGSTLDATPGPPPPPPAPPPPPPRPPRRLPAVSPPSPTVTDGGIIDDDDDEEETASRSALWRLNSATMLARRGRKWLIMGRSWYLVAPTGVCVW